MKQPTAVYEDMIVRRGRGLRRVLGFLGSYHIRLFTDIHYLFICIDFYLLVCSGATPDTIRQLGEFMQKVSGTTRFIGKEENKSFL